MARYEVSFVIDTDVEDAGQQPWWLMLGENPMPVEWLEYVMVRDLQVDEQVLDVEFLPDGGSISHAYRADARGVAYAVRPGELNVRPVEVIRHPNGDADWLIIGEPLEAQ